MHVFRRPRSLLEVSQRTLADRASFDLARREFLDFFYSNPTERGGAIAQQPVPLDDLRDAYLGATAEHLARCYGLPVPEWSEAYGFALTRPHFAGGLEALKAILIIESPTAFRRRLIFISRDALSRPRKPEDAPVT